MHYFNNFSCCQQTKQTMIFIQSLLALNKNLFSYLIFVLLEKVVLFVKYFFQYNNMFSYLFTYHTAKGKFAYVLESMCLVT